VPGSRKGLAPLKDLVNAGARRAASDLEQNRINIQSQLLVLSETERAETIAASGSLPSPTPPWWARQPAQCGQPGQPARPYYYGAYGSLLAQIFRRNFPNYTAGFSLTVPIRNRAAQADFATDQLQMRQQELQLEKSVAQVSVDVRNALDRVRGGTARYENRSGNAEAGAGNAGGRRKRNTSSASPLTRW